MRWAAQTRYRGMRPGSKTRRSTANKRGGRLRPLTTQPKNQELNRHSEGDPVERGVIRFELLDNRSSHGELLHQLLDLGVHLPMVHLRVLLVVPEADGHQLLLFRCDQEQLVQEALLLLEQRQDLLLKRDRKFRQIIRF